MYSSGANISIVTDKRPFLLEKASPLISILVFKVVDGNALNLTKNRVE